MNNFINVMMFAVLLLLAWVVGVMSATSHFKNICGNGSVIMKTEKFVNLEFTCKVVSKEVK